MYMILHIYFLFIILFQFPLMSLKFRSVLR